LKYLKKTITSKKSKEINGKFSEQIPIAKTNSLSKWWTSCSHCIVV